MNYLHICSDKSFLPILTIFMELIEFNMLALSIGYFLRGDTLLILLCCVNGSLFYIDVCLRSHLADYIFQLLYYVR